MTQKAGPACYTATYRTRAVGSVAVTRIYVLVTRVTRGFQAHRRAHRRGVGKTQAQAAGRGRFTEQSSLARRALGSDRACWEGCARGGTGCVCIFDSFAG